MINAQKQLQGGGFIQIIIIIVLIVIVLSLLGISLSSLFSNPVLHDNFGFLGNWIAKIWNNYLSAPFVYLWNIWTSLIWESFINTIKGLKNGVNPFGY